MYLGFGVAGEACILLSQHFFILVSQIKLVFISFWRAQLVGWKKKKGSLYFSVSRFFFFSFCSVSKFNFFLNVVEIQNQTLYKSYNKACPSK